MRLALSERLVGRAMGGLARSVPSAVLSKTHDRLVLSIFQTAVVKIHTETEGVVAPESVLHGATALRLETRYARKGLLAAVSKVQNYC